MDEAFTEAEIRWLVKRIASDRRRDERCQRLGRAADPENRAENGTTTGTQGETPLERKPAV